MKMTKLLAIILSVVMIAGMIVLPTTASVTSLSGEGTEASPYLIGTADELAFMRDKVNAGDAAYVSAYYKLTANIDLNDVTNYANWATQAPSNNWTAIGTGNVFKGNFDGNNKTIQGLYLAYEASSTAVVPAGLFGDATNATIKNLTLQNTYISVTASAKSLYLGAIVGRLNGGTIENCSVYGKIIVNGTAATADGGIGGIIGRAQTSAVTVTNCANHASINVSVGGTAMRLAGIVGVSVAPLITITGTYNTANLIGNVGVTSLGGLAGLIDKFEMGNCYNSGNISAVSSGSLAGVAGIAANIRSGKGACTIDNTFQLGTITVEGNLNSSNVGDYIAGGGVGSVTKTNCDVLVMQTGAKIREVYGSFVKGGEKVAEGQGIMFGASFYATPFINAQEGTIKDYTVGITITYKNAESETVTLNVPAVETLTYNETTKTIDFTGYLIGIDLANLGTEFTATAYVKKGETVIYTTTGITRSVTSVAENMGGSLDANGNYVAASN